MLLASLALILGLAGLLWSADRFISGAAATARILGMSPLLIGLTIVSLGTSAPELMVSASAALRGAGEIAIGNAIGSNLANIGMVLGVTALIAPIPVHGMILRRELLLLLFVTASAAALLLDSYLGRFDGTVLLVSLILCLTFLSTISRKHTECDPDEAGIDIPELSLGAAVTWLLFGLLLLTASAELLVWGAVHLALELGVSQMVIGLTAIAIGTSLPELAASGMSAWKGHHDIALGNILGSNLFNLLGVTSVAVLIQPLTLDPLVLTRDYAAMTLITLVLAVIVAISRIFGPNGEHARIGRRAGAVLLFCYASYYYFLFIPHWRH